MAQRGVREYYAKKLISKKVPSIGYEGRVVLVEPDTDLNKFSKKHKWLSREKLVVKPDQLFGKRGKHKLILLNATFPEVKKFLKKNMNRTVKVGKTTGKLTHFIIEPFVSHDKEYYLAIKTARDYDAVFFSKEGGIDIESNWDKVMFYKVPISENMTFNTKEFESKLNHLDAETKRTISTFVKEIYSFFKGYHFSYLEFNPFVITGKKATPLDVVARLDDTAEFECQYKWGDVEFPTPFGREFTKEEQFIRDLDEKTGASLKLTVLNPEGRVWTMVAGGGASVIYADTITDLGFAKELANYGEYSGDPNTEHTYLYAKTILDLMTRKKDPKNRSKILIIGGGIANFTDVAKTFKGIIMALTEYKEKLKKAKAKIYVRRGGPNYEEGLTQMRDLGKTLGVPIEVYGPETHMTRIVSLALGWGKR